MSASNPLILTVLGMGTVLIVLYLINIMIVVMGKVLAPKAVPAVPAAPAVPAIDVAEEETLAVIMAAVSDAMGGRDKIESIHVRPL